MSFIGKYRAGYTLALSRELVYRVNFAFGRLRETFIYAALLFLYLAVPGNLGAYASGEIATYIVGGAFLSSFLLVYAMNPMANEVNDGDLTNYLLRPISYLGYWTSQQMARRTIALVAACAQVALLMVCFPFAGFVGPASAVAVLGAIVLTLGALVVVQIIDFLEATLAFWTGRAFGPRWMITVNVSLMSGSYLPIDLLPEPIRSIIFATPFPYLIWAPLTAYLGDLSQADIGRILLIQLGWAIFLGGCLYLLWRRGVKSYEAYGR